MRRWLAVVIGATFLSVFLPLVALAQAQPTQQEVVSKFTSWTEATGAAAGYQKDPFCIDASLQGMPQLGGMGYHAIKASLVTGALDALNPPVLVIDPLGDKVMAVEYLVPDAGQARPSLFSTPFDGPDKHDPEGPAFYSLHLWLIPNPAGQLTAFNPNVTCPAGTGPPPPPVAPSTGDASLPWMPIGLLGSALLLVGLAITRKASGGKPSIG